MLNAALMLCETALGAESAAAMSRAFHDALVPTGVSYLQIRRYQRPPSRLTARAHWDAGGFVARYARRGWIGSASSDYVCFSCNPLLEPVATGVTSFRFSDYAPRADAAFGQYWEAMSEGCIGDAFAGVAYGRDRHVASLHIGYHDDVIDDDVARPVQMAASIMAQALLRFDVRAHDERPRLSQRERDALGFVADGKTDWEIGQIMGVSEATARFHVDNGRRKLGAVNRAQAVACYLAEYGFFGRA